jgi:hypothetical protein
MKLFKFLMDRQIFGTCFRCGCGSDRSDRRMKNENSFNFIIMCIVFYAKHNSIFALNIN